MVGLGWITPLEFRCVNPPGPNSTIGAICSLQPEHPEEHRVMSCPSWQAGSLVVNTQELSHYERDLVRSAYLRAQPEFCLISPLLLRHMLE
jgi:hypothetical protein